MWTMTVPLYKARRERHPTLDEVLHSHGEQQRHFEPRDLDIIEALYLRRFLTTAQIAREFFLSDGGHQGNRTCQIRLKKLYERGFVDRFRPPGEMRRGTNPFIWTIDQIGFELLSHLRGDRVVRWDQKEKVPEMSRVIHEVELNEFCLTLLTEARQKGLDPIWLTTRQCVQRVEDQGQGRLYAPDAIFLTLSPDGQEQVLHIEYERSCDRRWFVRKLSTWDLYRSRELWKGVYPKVPQILVVGHRGAAPDHGSILPLRALARSRKGIYFLALEDMVRRPGPGQPPEPVPADHWPVFTGRKVLKGTVEVDERIPIWELLGP